MNTSILKMEKEVKEYINSLEKELLFTLPGVVLVAIQNRLKISNKDMALVCYALADKYAAFDLEKNNDKT